MSTKRVLPSNDNIVPESVRQAHVKGLLPHGYIVAARTVDARIHFARAFGELIACAKKTAPCGTCAECLAFAQYGESSVLMVTRDHESRDVSIEDVRKGIATLLVSRPFARRVVCIPEADLLSDEAADALLKSIEEPPERVCWVLGVPSFGRVLPTIASRLSSLRLTGDGAVVHKKSILHDPAATLALTRTDKVTRERAHEEVVALVCDLERDLDRAVRMGRPALPLARALRVAAGVLDELEHGNGNLKLLLVTASVRAAEASK